jgi:hypothetical protein
LLRQLRIGLGDHGRARLLQDLRPAHVGRLRSEVGVHDAAARGALRFDRLLEVRDDRDSKRLWESAEGGHASSLMVSIAVSMSSITGTDVTGRWKTHADRRRRLPVIVGDVGVGERHGTRR